MKFKSKILSAIIAGTMAVTAYGDVMPSVISEIQNSIQVSAEEVSTATSGTCGDNLTWELDGEGTFTISGSGEMKDYEVVSPFCGRTDIKRIIISDGVTKISGWAFEDCSAIESVSIPDSVTIIGGGAFCGCSGLEDLTIPDSVSYIGESAFSKTPYLESLKSEDSIKYAGKVAYKADEDIAAAVIKKGTKGIAGSAFQYCKGLTSVTIPDSVTNIGGSAFGNCEKLTSITIPDSVVRIGNFAFDYCKGLASVTVPDSVISIGNGAFSHTPFEDGFKRENGVKYVGKVAYRLSEDAADAVIKNGTKGIADCAFRFCSGITSITVPDSVVCIGSEAFAFCSKLNDITIENPECEINRGFICNGDNDHGWYFNGVIRGYKNSTAEAYAEKYGYKFETIEDEPAITTIVTTTDITSETTVTTVSGKAEYESPSLVLGNAEGAPGDTVTVPVKVFCDNNFESLCAVVKWDDISLKADEVNGAGNASAVIGVNGKGDGYVEVVAFGGSALADGAVANIKFTIPKNAVSGTVYDLYFGNIETYAIYHGANNGENIAPNVPTYGGSVTVKGKTTPVTTTAPAVTTATVTTTISETPNLGIDKYGALEYIRIDNDSEFIDRLNNSVSDDGVYDYIMIIGCDKDVESVDVPQEIDGLPVKIIGESAFMDNVKLKKVNLPEGLEEIQHQAFSGCTALGSINIPKSVLGINENAFDNTKILDELLGEIKYIDNWVVKSCDEITSANIKEGTVGIAGGTFSMKEKLTSVELPESLKYICANAFSFCNALTDVVIPDSVEYIGRRGFHWCENLETVTLGSNLKAISWETFDLCSKLKNVVLPESVRTIGYNAFSNCDSLETITISNKKCDIGNDMSESICNRTGQNEQTGDFEAYYYGVIYGYKNSTAQAYAEKYGYKFEAIDDEPAVTTTVVTTKPSITTTITTVTTAANTTTAAKSTEPTVTTTAVSTTAPQTTEPTETSPVGDANGDNKLNVRDAAFIAAKLAQGKASDLPESADFNGDGKVNVRDAAAIAKFLATGKK